MWEGEHLQMVCREQSIEKQSLNPDFFYLIKYKHSTVFIYIRAAHYLEFLVSHMISSSASALSLGHL